MDIGLWCQKSGFAFRKCRSLASHNELNELHFQIQHISGYSSGAPRAACNSLFPRHDGVVSQSIPSTHRFEVSKAHKTYFAGEKIPIALTVENTDTDAGFKGFIIQVKYF